MFFLGDSGSDSYFVKVDMFVFLCLLICCMPALNNQNSEPTVVVVVRLGGIVFVPVVGSNAYLTLPPAALWDCKLK